jgi:acetolactate synthase regulatory subunit
MPGLAMATGTASEGVKMPTARLNLHVQSGTDALHRVLCVCRRRGLDVIALGYRDERIALTVAGQERQMGQIDHWLGAVVSVIDVQGVDASNRD